MLRLFVMREELVDTGGYEDIAKTIGKIAGKIIPWVWSFCCILAIELMIRWNHIDGVNTISNVGQAIPFFIGFGSLAIVVIECNDDRNGLEGNVFQVFVVMIFASLLVVAVVIAVAVVGAIVGAIAYAVTK